MIKRILTIAAITMIAAIGCCKVTPVAQDGSTLWFQNSPSYEEVLASVETNVDPSLGREEFSIKDVDGKRIITGGSETGVMYGVYALQRMIVLGQDGPGINVQEKPRYDIRILNHWDNMDDSVERGYAGKSMWEWTSDKLPVERVELYGKLNASIGINGAAVNNVNSNAIVLDEAHLQRVKEIADILRKYGMKTYISIKWTSPMTLSGLKTGDPLDPKVRQWWKDKAKEIYELIPDFGGFLVKANSEGQAGPQDYGRTHADGANMLAEAVAPYGGIVMWRAFVYSPTSPDRANQAVEEFLPLDGDFADNVIVQIKNGPIDFQPREPFSPLFGQLRKTKMMMEFQITQEYLGFSNHLVYHGTTFEEALDADTYRDGEGSTVANVIDAIAGVANTGQDHNFCGYTFAQSNWYAFGRLAWDPELSAEQIADEWIHQTFAKPEGMSDKAYEKKFVKPVFDIVMTSRETAVNYMQPLGFHHIFGGSHYGPGPWEQSSRPDWSPVYYHKAEAAGVGFDRTATGSNNVAQYNEPLASTYANIETCPENLLLWFHHVPWDYKMKSGNTLWEEICYHYDKGITAIEEYQETWASLKPYVGEDIFNEATKKLEIQRNDADWWRDACVGYFQTFSGMDLPSDVRPFVTPIDSLIGRSILSDRSGMPTHDENNKPVILDRRQMMEMMRRGRGPRPGDLSSN